MDLNPVSKFGEEIPLMPNIVPKTIRHEMQITVPQQTNPDTNKSDPQGGKTV